MQDTPSTFLGVQNGEGEGAVVLPLVLHMECTATEGEMNANVAATLDRGYTSILPYLYSEPDGTVSICGAGPSLGETLSELKGDVFAVNSAISYLLERGVVPKWAMIWDCAEICERFAIPHPDVTYLIGSRCHPKVFKRLKDCKVVVWHADGDHNIMPFLEGKKVKEPLIKGGTTGVTRGIYVAYALGYRDFHVFGADSSYSEDGRTHVVSSLVHEHRMKVMIAGRWFDTTAQWAAQIEEMKIIYPMFKRSALQAEITVYDKGMMAWIVQLMDMDLEKSVANAMALIELTAQNKGVAGPGTPGALPNGTIKEIHEKAPHLVAGAMKTLQPLEGSNV